MKTTCAICGKEIDSKDAVLDKGVYLCKECSLDALIENLPSSCSTSTFKVVKRIVASTRGYQFLTSGYPNRSKDKQSFSSMDGLYEKELLPDLKPREADLKIGRKLDPRQGIEVEVLISRVKQEGFREMWVFGYRAESRLITPFKPTKVRRTKNGTSAVVKHGSMYISTWCEKDYFPDVPEGEVFPVYMKVQRKKTK